MEDKKTMDINSLFLKIILHDDKDAFREVYMQFFAPLVVYAMRFVPIRETCEDIVQDTFVKIWENRKSLKIDMNNDSNWKRNLLVSLVKNACINHIRKEENHQEYLRKIQEFAPEGEDVYSVTELEAKLSAALDRMPENLRTIFEMNRFQGKTYSTIALEKNLSIKTIESYMSKALKMLFKEMKEYLTVFL